MDLWAYEVERWLPPGTRPAAQQTYYGGLYQRLVIEA